MSEEFKKKLTNAEELLRQVEGETKEQAIEKWWKLNGLDPDKAMAQRQETYAKQKQETMKVYNANSTTNPN